MGIETAQNVQEAQGEVRVHIPCGLISQEDLGVDHNGSGYSHPLLLPAGEPATGKVVFPVQIQPAQNGIDPAMNQIWG